MWKTPASELLADILENARVYRVHFGYTLAYRNKRVKIPLILRSETNRPDGILSTLMPMISIMRERTLLTCTTMKKVGFIKISKRGPGGIRVEWYEDESDNRSGPHKGERAYRRYKEGYEDSENNIHYCDYTLRRRRAADKTGLLCYKPVNESRDFVIREVYSLEIL